MAVIRTLPEAPRRGETGSVFASKANAWVEALSGWTGDANAVAASIVASESNIEDIYSSVQDINTSIASIANYVGLWSSLTGSLNTPATVKHQDAFWLLNGNLVDVTSSEPSDTNDDWALVEIGAQYVVQPSGVTSGTVRSLILDLESTDFASLISGATHAKTNWEVFDSSNNLVFSSYDDPINLTSITTSALSAGDVYSYRVRYEDDSGYFSSWSFKRSVTIPSTFVEEPSITSEGPLLIGGTLTGSTYTVYGSSAAHIVSSWEMYENDGVTLIHSSYDDASNLTTWSPDMSSVPSSDIKVRVKYRGEGLDYSNWSDLSTIQFDGSPVASKLFGNVDTWNNAAIAYDASSDTVYTLLETYPNSNKELTIVSWDGTSAAVNWSKNFLNPSRSINSYASTAYNGSVFFIGSASGPFLTFGSLDVATKNVTFHYGLGGQYGFLDRSGSEVAIGITAVNTATTTKTMVGCAYLPDLSVDSFNYSAYYDDTSDITVLDTVMTQDYICILADPEGTTDIMIHVISKTTGNLVGTKTVSTDITLYDPRVAAVDPTSSNEVVLALPGFTEEEFTLCIVDLDTFSLGWSTTLGFSVFGNPTLEIIGVSNGYIYVFLDQVKEVSKVRLSDGNLMWSKKAHVYSYYNNTLIGNDGVVWLLGESGIPVLGGNYPSVVIGLDPLTGDALYAKGDINSSSPSSCTKISEGHAQLVRTEDKVFYNPHLNGEWVDVPSLVPGTTDLFVDTTRTISITDKVLIKDTAYSASDTGTVTGADTNVTATDLY